MFMIKDITVDFVAIHKRMNLNENCPQGIKERRFLLDTKLFSVHCSGKAILGKLFMSASPSFHYGPICQKIIM